MLRFVFATLTVAMLSVVPVMADPVGFIQTNLASDVPGLAQTTDPNLVNAWGMGASATSPVWIGDNGNNTAVLYNGAGIKQGLVVSLPGDGVTGVLFSNVSGSFNGDTFLFASEDGTVSGWRGALGTNAETLALSSVANVYKGLAGASIGGTEYTYIANFRSGKIDVLKGNNGAPNLTGNFTDPGIPNGYAPFGVQTIGNEVYVTYALQDGAKKDDDPGAGHGFVSAFDLQGLFLRRVASQGALNSPWGLALAPSGFGNFGGDLLVGNFGDGTINAYNPSGGFIGTLKDPNDVPISIDGLWGLRFGIGGSPATAQTLFFTAGPDEESHGLFGTLTQAPEPGAWEMVAAGVLALVLVRRPLKRASR
jgi:uncharacterized protein (TIGR03118 family)